MSKREYAEYRGAVAAFMAGGLDSLTSNAGPYFSWRRCECCGRPEGGDRYDCTGFNRITGEVERYEYICADCVYYADHGQLDDGTMVALTD